MSMIDPALLMTMSDIAALARVQRPVVSVWRTRAARTDSPFPAPVTRRQGQDLFAAGQVADWLTATHRGNNPEASADAAAHGALDGAAQATEATFRAVTALLALRSVAGVPLGSLSADDLLDTADEHDPDDDMLYREVEGAGDALPRLAAYVDVLVEAAYSEAGAFERLLADRFRLDLRDLGDTALNGPGLALMAWTAAALAATQTGDPVFVDPTGSASDIVLAIAGAAAEGTSGELAVLTANGDSDVARLLRRRLLVHRITRAGLEVQDSGGFAVAGHAVHATQFPPAHNAAMTPAEILAAIDQIVLQMDNAQLGVIMAPASVLTDAGLTRDADELRSTILRSGRVRAIVRLPAGLLSHKPQQHQALWVLGPAYAHVELAERWAMVADLTTISLGPAVIADLVSDLVAALGDRATVRAHSFRFAQVVPTRTLLATRDSLVAGARTVTHASAPQGAALAVRVEELLGALAYAGPVTDAPSLARIAIEPTSRAGTAATGTVEQLMAAGHLRYIAGNRLEASDIVEDQAQAAGIRIIAPAEVLGEHPLGRRRIDRLRFAAGYSAGRVTEPGDVVFCTAPRVAAIVDAEGTSVVAFPARILRINRDDPNGLVSEMLAADITALPAGHRRWRRWQLRRVHHRQRAALAGVMASIRLEHEQTRDRLAQLDELNTLVMAGVAAGTLTLTLDSESLAPLEGTS
ncbi:hypothetical protein E3T33_03815 [Cryobacterium sp. TMT1-2-1]|uniref:hypothetical protein n=1 Tax=Cryobacterium sp. TMT1-2-1 TaxID=1259232 RepID=UPI00106A8E9F|nr:hypothetical protein [Cryobacterium sp. TMT1-2-1]TFD47162.1 hypothetical protein E3T33_03815 [Cryobacterium sp. TMT1-2-1]